MIKALHHVSLAAIVLVTLAVDRAGAQDDVAETDQVVTEVIEADVIEADVIEADVEVIKVDEEVMQVDEERFQDVAMAIAMPVDNNQLMLRRHAQVECALVRRVCKLTDEQTKKLAEIDDKWVDKIGKKVNQQIAVRQQQPGLLAMFFGAQPAAQRIRASPKVTVQKAVAEHIDALLSDEQKMLYQAEQQRRTDFRNDAVADALIESLQERLGMTDEQRTAIKKRMLPWVAQQNLQTMHYFSNNNYYPEIPTHLLSKDLSKDQMAAYNSLQRYTFTDDNFNDGQVPIVIKQ